MGHAHYYITYLRDMTLGVLSIMTVPISAMNDTRDQLILRPSLARPARRVAASAAKTHKTEAIYTARISNIANISGERHWCGLYFTLRR